MVAERRPDPRHRRPRRAALAAQRLTARAVLAVGAAALQRRVRISSCCRRSIRLQPLEQPEPLQRMDPLTRGSIFHDDPGAVLPRAARSRRAAGHARRPSTRARRARRGGRRGGRASTTRLAPAVERVWSRRGRVDAPRPARLAGAPGRRGDEWMPSYFEFGFGRVPGERDAASAAGRRDARGRLQLRGAIDLIEETSADEAAARHRSQDRPKPDRIDRSIIGGGAVLQPVLYALAVERRSAVASATGGCSTARRPAASDRSTRSRSTRTARRAGLEVLRDRRSRHRDRVPGGAPAERRVRPLRLPAPSADRTSAGAVPRKPQARLADLLELRSRR